MAHLFSRARAIFSFALAATGAAACGGGSYEGSDAGAAGSNTGGSGSPSGSVVSSGVTQSGTGVSSGAVASGSSASGACAISASNYDQSCTVDTDCTEVSAGDYCSATTCLCGASAINVGALAQFIADISKTPIGSGALAPPILSTCGCPVFFGPCCRHGMCQENGCASPADTFPACADAGGTCTLSVQPACLRAGPPGACASSDETCCLP
jgi:hypothetical protein